MCGQRAREFVARRIRLVHVRGRRAKEATDDQEDERREPIDLARCDQTRGAREHIETLIAGSALPVYIRAAFASV